LIDAYDLSRSNETNIVEQNDDGAFLKIVNLSGTLSEDIDEMKQKKVIMVDGDGDVSWILKEINDKAMQNHNETLRNDIHIFSKTPNLTDESFAQNLSGVAIEFKLWPLEQTAAQKERKFKKGLQRRIELICNFLRKKGKDYEWRDVAITFSRNMPQNTKELSEMIEKLTGLISERTALSILPFIDNVQQELDFREQERESIIRIPEIDNEDEEDEAGENNEE